MPAIQPARLKRQVAQLGEKFPDSAAYTRALNELLDFYADRTRRPGRDGAPAPLIPAYNAPKPLLREIRRDIIERMSAAPDTGLALADLLWEQPFLECRFLAIHTLGQIAPDPPEVVLERLQGWAQATQEDQLLDSIFTVGVARLRSEAGTSYLKKLKDWLGAREDASRILGLRALLPLLEDQELQTLPTIFHQLAPICREMPAEVRPYVLKVIQSLAQRTPKETAYFLREVLSTSSAPGPAWLIRRTLKLFPAESQSSLRSALKASSV